jgi:hypothetical protein
MMDVIGGAGELPLEVTPRNAIKGTLHRDDILLFETQTSDSTLNSSAMQNHRIFTRRTFHRLHPPIMYITIPGNTIVAVMYRQSGRQVSTAVHIGHTIT